MNAVIVAAWLLIGAAIALRMVRRGHSPWLWWLLVTTGPLAGLVALSAKDEERGFTPKVLREGFAGPGNLHVLAGVDGSERTLEACRAIPSLFGDHLGTLTLAAVLDYDIGQMHEPEEAERKAELWLQQAASTVTDAGGAEPECVLLVGSPVSQLVAWAGEHAVDVVAVASSSHSTASHVVVGSVARGLLDKAPCPVVTVPAGVRPAAERTRSGGTDADRAGADRAEADRTEAARPGPTNT